MDTFKFELVEDAAKMAPAEIPTGPTDDPKDVDLASVSQGKNFRLDMRKAKLLLTYKTHLDKNMYGLFLDGLGKANQHWIAHETADENNPYEHSHVLIVYSERVQTTNARYYDFQGIHPNIKKILTKNHYSNALRYMVKEDKSNYDSLMKLADENDLTLFDRVSECKTVQDVLAMAETANEAIGLTHMFNFRRRKTPTVLEPKFDWQKDLADEIEDEPHKRKIIWYYDNLGGSGKSELGKYLAVERKEDVYIVSQFGGATNAATIVKSAIDSGWSGHAMLVNLTRSSEAKAIYEPLEMIKDGMITATKYQGQTMVFANPHLVVFANFLPDVRSMSLDRWEIRVLENKEVVDVLDGYKLNKLQEEAESENTTYPDNDGEKNWDEESEDSCWAEYEKEGLPYTDDNKVQLRAYRDWRSKKDLEMMVAARKPAAAK